MSIKRIGYESLVVADIIVTASATSTSKVIRAGTGGAVSHAILYAGKNSIVEAVTSGGVREGHLDKAFDSDTVLAMVYRHGGLTPTQRQRVIDNARKFLNRPYDKIGAAGAGVNSSNGSMIAAGVCKISVVGCVAGGIAIKNNAGAENADKAFFCSELVVRAFELAGVKLVDSKPSFAHPSLLLRSSVLQYVGHLIGE
jgi:hypothetical protein